MGINMMLKWKEERSKKLIRSENIENLVIIIIILVSIALRVNRLLRDSHIKDEI